LHAPRQAPTVTGGTASKSPKVGALILSYNNGSTLLNCVESLLRQSYENLQVIVIDNASSDESVETLENSHPDRCIVLRNETNRGTASRNPGIEKALELSCEMMFLTDGDTVMDSDVIEKLVSEVLSDSRVGIAGASCYEVNRGPAAPVVRISPWTAQIVTKGYVTKPAETEAIGSALVTRAVFSSTGFYNPSYFAYYEDADLCVRARRMGFKVITVPQARYHHYPATSVRQVPGLRGFISMRNRFIFVRSTQRPSAWLQLFIANPVLLARTCGLWLVSGRLTELRTTFLGYVAGVLYFLRGRDSVHANAIAEALLGYKVSLRARE
jgi:GT2 family glycosyltransferase